MVKFTLQMLVLVCCCLLCSEGLQAQPAMLYGHVVDQHGKGVMSVTLNAGKQTVQSQQNGNFQFPEKSILPITLRISALGFSSKTVQVDSIPSYAERGLLIQLDATDVALDEVLVTGRRNNSYLINMTELGGKFSGILKDLPQSVSMVSKEMMEDRQAFQLTDMIPDLAGVSQASAYDDLTIRGFNSGYANGLRLINGMRSAYGYGTSFWKAPLTANLEAIEVLKGPGASLFGDVVPGGTVNLVTKKPLDQRRTSLSFSAGSFQTLRTTLDAGGPLDAQKHVLYRFNVAYESTRTFRDNNRKRDILIAPSFTFRPMDGTQIDVDVTYDDFDGFLDRGIGIRNNDFYAQDRSFNVNQPTDYYRSKFLIFSGRLSQELSKNVQLHLNYMKSVYREDLNEFRTRNTYANPPENTIMYMRFLSKKVTDYTDNLVGYFTYRHLGKTISHHFIIGTDYAQYEGDKNNVQREARSRLVNGTEEPLLIDLEKPKREIVDANSYVWLPQSEFPFLNPYKSIGIYLQDQLSIGEKFHMVLGIRREHYRSSSADLAQSYETRQYSWLPRVGLTYHINGQINYFASYSQGYVPVGADFLYNHDQYGSDKPFQAERSYQVETGWKMGFFQNQLQGELSLFHIGRENMLVNTGEMNADGFPVYRQAGEVLSQGIEVDVRGQFNKEFQIMANYSYNYTAVKASSLSAEVGLPLANAPKHMGSIWAKYVFSHSILKGIGIGGGTNFMNSRRMENPMPVDAQGSVAWGRWPAYQVWNAALYYHRKELQLTVNFNNLFDKYYYLGGFDYTRGFIGTPRSLMTSMAYSF